MKRKRRRILQVAAVVAVAAGAYLCFPRPEAPTIQNRDAAANAPAAPEATPKRAEVKPPPKAADTSTAAAPKPVPAPAKTDPAAPSPAADPEAVVAKANTLVEQGKAHEAAGLLSELIVGDRVRGASRERVLAVLDKLNETLIFSPAPAPNSTVYVVRPGDLLLTIAKPYKVTPQFLMRVNRIRDARRIRPRQRLKVITGPFSARVDLSDFELVVLLAGRYVQRYAIGIGKDRSTPTGTFTVDSKLINPTYYDSENGQVVAADDPKNPLGERWLGIGDGYGIHGTIEPASIGKAASRGCIRLREKDVAEVYDLLIKGSTVVIRD